MTGASPFHEGEQRVQAQLGVRDIEAWARKVVRSYLPDEHRAFHTAQPFLVAAARDEQGRPWATLLTGREGFATSPDDQTLRLDALPLHGDALAGALVPGSDLGLLGIELASRRRNRVNGRIAATGDALVFRVEQSFGNCPQYIREREWFRVSPQSPPSEPRRSAELSEAQRTWVEDADTFFIASGHRGEGDDPTFGMDASHRGGAPGLVAVTDGRRVSFPDYAGNNHFNTIGNLVLDSRVGLLFVDFDRGSLLQLTGRATIVWDGEELERFPGARRVVHVELDAVVELSSVLPLRWRAAAEPLRPLRVVAKVRESRDITSFVLAADDDENLPAFEAGQHLPIRLEIPGESDPVRRTYSLSNSSGGGHYRISVKREPLGVASRFLHDQVEVGTVIQARDPAGHFVLGCSECPIALVSAGVGVTPMLSMLHELADEERAGARPIWWLHVARDGEHLAFGDELRALSERLPSLRTRVHFSRPGASDIQGVDYDAAGRLDGRLVREFVDDSAAHHHLCGPVSFMASVQEGLEASGVAGDRIHSESFGPVG